MRADSFGRSIAFAAVAALGMLGAWVTLAPLLGARFVVVGQLVVTTGAYLYAIAPSRRRALLAGAIGAAGSATVALFAASWAELAIGSALVVGVVRSGLLFRSRALRAVVLEAALGLGGLVLARFVAWPGPGGAASALWAYLLVQSVFFLAGGVARRRSTAQGDAFERARERLEALLEGAV